MATAGGAGYKPRVGKYNLYDDNNNNKSNNETFLRVSIYSSKAQSAVL